MSRRDQDNYPADWDSRRRKVYRRDNYTCQNCGARGGSFGDAELHAHHGVPVGKGGSHKLSNLTTYCKKCHQAIHANDKIAPTAGLNIFNQSKNRAASRPHTARESRRKDNSERDYPDSLEAEHYLLIGLMCLMTEFYLLVFYILDILFTWFPQLPLGIISILCLAIGGISTMIAYSMDSDVFSKMN